MHKDKPRHGKLDRTATERLLGSIIKAAASHIVHVLLSLPALISIGFHIPPYLFPYYFGGLVLHLVDRTLRCVNLVQNRHATINEIGEEKIYSDFASDGGYLAPPHYIMAVTAPGFVLAGGVRPGAFVYVTDDYCIEQRAEVICLRCEQGNGAHPRQVLFLLCPRYHRRSKRTRSIMIEGPYYRSRLLVTADPVIVLAPQEAAPFALAYTRQLKAMFKDVKTRLYVRGEPFAYQLHRVLQPETVFSDVEMIALNWHSEQPGPVHSQHVLPEAAAPEDVRQLKKEDVKSIVGAYTTIVDPMAVIIADYLAVFGSEALEAVMRSSSVLETSKAVPTVVGFAC